MKMHSSLLYVITISISYVASKKMIELAVATLTCVPAIARSLKALDKPLAIASRFLKACVVRKIGLYLIVLMIPPYCSY